MDEARVLIIEDDKSIQNLLRISLKASGYRCDTAESGLSGISLFLANNPGIILLDLGLPDIDGSEVLAQIRMRSQVPVIVISARDQEREKVVALDAGADDYITKPFNIPELLARIRVALRHAVPRDIEPTIFSVGGLFIDFERRIVTVDGKDVHLTPIEYRASCPSRRAFGQGFDPSVHTEKGMGLRNDGRISIPESFHGQYTKENRTGEYASALHSDGDRHRLQIDRRVGLKDIQRKRHEANL